LAELGRRAPDLRIINLETSITKNEDCTDKGISYRMSPENVHCLTAAEIDCCVLANNHVLDWGPAGLIETLETLERAKIRHAGAGRDGREAAAPAILAVPGKGRVLVFSYGSTTSGIPRDWAARQDSPGVNLLKDLSKASLERIAKQVQAARQTGDVVVASIHWGANWGYDIPGAQRRFAQGLVDEAGVDIVYGHSSHHPKGIQIHNQKIILYGCGDFVDDYEGIAGYESFRDDLVLMYFLSIASSSGKLVSCEMTPLRIRNFRLNRPSSDDIGWLQNVLNREGEWLGTSVELREDSTFVLR
jgi:poly-gamma-glutamate synthesis protein (capsule biosynthesis protein)